MDEDKFETTFRLNATLDRICGTLMKRVSVGAPQSTGINQITVLVATYRLFAPFWGVMIGRMRYTQEPSRLLARSAVNLETVRAK